MAHVCQIAIFIAGVICVSIFTTQGMKIVPMILNGNDDKCSSNDDRQRLLKISHNVLQTTLSESPSRVCGPGYWRQVFYFNASSRVNQFCPGNWNTIAGPVRGCAGSSIACRSAFSDDINIAYSKVCGRIIGEGVRTPDAFFRYIQNQTTIEHNYLDGISITHGANGLRTHIWSLAAGHSAAISSRNIARCPCDNNDCIEAPFPPPEVRDNYFCDRSDEFDPLWIGESCMHDNPCCSFRNPPYFSVQLPAATTDRIELRICNDQYQDDENILMLFAEIYVQS